MARTKDGAESYKRFSLDDAVYLRANDVAAVLRRSRSNIYEMVKKGLLPKPVKLTANYSVWKRAEVLAAMEKLYAEKAAV